MASTDAEVKVPFFKKKGKGRPTTSRKRSESPPATKMTVDVPSSSKSQVVLPSRKQAANLLSAGTKRTATQREADAADEDEPARDGPDVQYTAAGSHVNAALEILAGDEAEELLRKKQKRADSDEEDAPDDGMYRGQKGYQKHLAKNKEVPKAMRVGPQRASGSTIRTVTIVDYQPDVCKDYKETGYCGFGDTCKFLHDRGTYLQGWQLDKLAADPKRQAEDESSDEDSDDEIPFACLICRKAFTDPVVTRCGHYFDSTCAIKRFARTPKCAACGTPTGGIFNRADKVIEKMKKTRGEHEEAEEGEGKADGVEIEGLEKRSDGEDDE
ncbi:spliceosomal zinc finger-containing protein [Phanerochaete sordida]|uniref:Pre-mRNA-splicing factor CWC24 n=1 Tax=Phanerochaete sordida TaxID=48140 RepID=A0A9P3LFL0_9APHY|nr:spliceosomal zinc finger-containing protein [Phanerochaete sordida]